MTVALEKTTTGGFPVTVCRVPWEGLGVDVRSAGTAEEALEMSVLNWKVEVEAAYFKVPGVQGTLEPENYYVPTPMQVKLMVRSDLERFDPHRILGLVTSSFVPVQNRDMVEFCDELVVEEGFRYWRAGCADGGRVVWMIVKGPDEPVVGGNTLDQYLVLRNAHDGTVSFEVMFTTINRVVGNVMSLGSKSVLEKLRKKHTSIAARSTTAAHVVLSASKACFGANLDLMRTLSGEPVSDQFLTRYLRTIYPDPASHLLRRRAVANRVAIHSLFDSICAMDGHDRTVYSLWDTITQFSDHHLPCRDIGRCPFTTRMSSILWGTRARRREADGRDLLGLLAGM